METAIRFLAPETAPAGLAEFDRQLEPRPARHGPGYGVQVITALQAMWRAVQARHPELSDVVLITGSGVGLRNGRRLRGHHCGGRWVIGEGLRAAELFISGEEISLGGAAVLEVMLHEAAHELAEVRGINDTSGAGNRYHNREFAALAEELGLARPAASQGTSGLSHCTLTDETFAAYRTAITALDGARLPHLPYQPTEIPADAKDDGETKPARSGSRLTVTCQCTDRRTIQLTPHQIDVGPVLCGNCHHPFTAPEGPAR